MDQRLYSSPEWARARADALTRDGHRCIVPRLMGGPECYDTLHVHHIVPVSRGGDPFDLDNLMTVCAKHHPMVEALRRFRAPAWKRCRHRHAYARDKRECERKLNQIAA